MTKIIAHRGARSIGPENSIAAAEIARNIGANLWETDVTVTRDGHLILFHDDDLLRTTDVLEKFPDRKSFEVDKFDLSEILMLDIGTTFIRNDPFGEIGAGNVSSQSLEAFKGEKIPTLEDALNYTKKTGWRVNLELKQKSSNQSKPDASTFNAFDNYQLPNMVIDMIRKLNIHPELMVISSFNHIWLKEVQTLFPEIEIQPLLGDDYDKTIDWTQIFSGNPTSDNMAFLCSGSLNFDTYNINSTMITVDEIAELKKMGKKVNLFTINNKDDMVKYINAGVDGIFTDYPQVMKTLLR
ncbi:MAG: hypothetical protein HQK70_03550 [Desulfamplus sp.]|nr:hypothetical protein [Desulfamplus sp.]